MVTYYPVWRRGYGYGFVACTVNHYGSSPYSFRASCTTCGDVGGHGTREQATDRAREHEAEHA